MQRHPTTRHHRERILKAAANLGFTMVELVTVIVIIGILAAFGIPRLPRTVERSKASEAFKYLDSVRASQERYQAQHGTYSDELTSLDMQLPLPNSRLVLAGVTPLGSAVA